MLKENLEKVEENIQAACDRAYHHYRNNRQRESFQIS